MLTPLPPNKRKLKFHVKGEATGAEAAHAAQLAKGAESDDESED